MNNVRFSGPEVPWKGKCDTLFTCRTVHENVAWRALCEEAKASALSVEEREKQHRQYAEKLSALIKPQGYLVSVERYDEGNAYAGLVHALERLGVRQVKGTHMQFSCKNGDDFSKIDKITPFLDESIMVQYCAGR